MRAEISSLSCYSSLFNSASIDYSWIQAPPDLNRNFLCSIGSVYDYERASCVSGTRKLLHFTYRNQEEYSFPYTTWPLPYFSVEAWVNPDFLTGTHIIYHYYGFVKLGFNTNMVIAVFPAGGCTYSYTVTPKKWTHLSYAYTNTPTIEVLISLL